MRKNGAGAHVPTYTQVGPPCQPLHGRRVATNPRCKGVGLIAPHLPLVRTGRHVQNAHRVIPGAFRARLLALPHRVFRAVHNCPPVHTALPLLLLPGIIRPTLVPRGADHAARAARHALLLPQELIGRAGPLVCPIMVLLRQCLQAHQVSEKHSVSGRLLEFVGSGRSHGLREANPQVTRVVLGSGPRVARLLVGLLLVQHLPLVEVFGEAGTLSGEASLRGELTARGARARVRGRRLVVVRVVAGVLLRLAMAEHVCSRVRPRLRGVRTCSADAHRRRDFRLLGRLHGFLPVVPVHRRLLDARRVIAGDVEVGDRVDAAELDGRDVIRLRCFFLGAWIIIHTHNQSPHSIRYNNITDPISCN